MQSFKRYALGAFHRGGALALGAACLALYRQQYFPSILGPLSVGITVAGVLGVQRYNIKMMLHERDGNARYQEILDELEEILPIIEEDLKLSEELRESCFRSMSMRECLEAWRRDPSLVEDRIAIFERLLQKTREEYSYNSKRCTLRISSDYLLEPYSFPFSEGFSYAEDFCYRQGCGGPLGVEYEGEMEERETKEELDKRLLHESLQFVWDIADILRGPEIDIPKEMLEMALNRIVKDALEEVSNELFSKKRLQEERDVEVLGEEGAEEFAKKKIVKTMPYMRYCEGYLKLMVCRTDFMQNVVKNVLEETNKDVVGVEGAEENKLKIFVHTIAEQLVTDITEVYASQEMTVEEVPEKILQLTLSQTEEALGEIVRNQVRIETERKEEENKARESVHPLFPPLEDPDILSWVGFEEGFAEMLQDETTK